MSKIKSILISIFLLFLVLFPFLSYLYTPNSTKPALIDIPEKCLKQYRSGGAIPGQKNCVRKAITTHGGMGGYYCTGSKGLEWSTSYCTINVLSEEQEAMGIKSIDRDDIPTFDKTHQNYHAYEVSNSCLKSKPYCSRDNIYQQLKKFPAPLTSGNPVEDEQISYAWPVGYVRHEVSDTNYTVTNVTLDPHLLSTGTVERIVIEDSTSVSVITRGKGTGLFPYLNEVLSDPLWSITDERIFN